MRPQEATANNADLWAHYLHQRWKAWLDPFGLAQPGVTDVVSRMLSEAAAASVASALALFVGQPVGRMFQANAPEVTQAIDEARAATMKIEIPEAYRYGAAFEVPPSTPFVPAEQMSAELAISPA